MNFNQIRQLHNKHMLCFQIAINFQLLDNVNVYIVHARIYKVQHLLS